MSDADARRSSARELLEELPELRLLGGGESLVHEAGHEGCCLRKVAFE